MTYEVQIYKKTSEGKSDELHLPTFYIGSEGAYQALRDHVESLTSAPADDAQILECYLRENTYTSSSKYLEFSFLAPAGSGVLFYRIVVRK